MPRPKYPSDHRRWFRVESAELAEETAYLTDAEFRALFLLRSVANEQKAHTRDDRITIAVSRLASLSPNRRDSGATAARVVRELCTKCAWELHENGATWTIQVRNWSKDQGFTPAELRRDSDETPAPTTTPTTTPIREESRPAKPAPDVVQKPRRVSAPETHPEALEFAAKFLRALGAAHTDPPIKLPSDSAFAGWQREARLMLTTDRRSFEDAKRVASWLFNDQGQEAHFWRKNVLSVGTFRKQFDRLAAAMNAPHHGGRDEFHGSKILRYLATREAAHPRPRAGGAVHDPVAPLRSVAELPAGER